MGGRGVASEGPRILAGSVPHQSADPPGCDDLSPSLNFWLYGSDAVYRAPGWVRRRRGQGGNSSGDVVISFRPLLIIYRLTIAIRESRRDSNIRSNGTWSLCHSYPRRLAAQMHVRLPDSFQLEGFCSCRASPARCWDYPLRRFVNGQCPTIFLYAYIDFPV